MGYKALFAANSLGYWREKQRSRPPDSVLTQSARVVQSIPEPRPPGKLGVFLGFFAPPMAGLSPQSPTPTAITLHQQSKLLEVVFSDGAAFRIPFELMRIYSPSAEVQGHGPGQEVLQTGKRHVEVAALEPVGHYAVKPTFSDGHDTGLFSWDYLYFLGSQQGALWQQYFERLKAANVDRDADMGLAASAGCGH